MSKRVLLVIAGIVVFIAFGLVYSLKKSIKASTSREPDAPRPTAPAKR